MTLSLFHLWRTRRRHALARQPGWQLVMAGCWLILLAALLNIAGNLAQLGDWLEINPAAQQLAYPGGLLLILFGMTRWIPPIAQLHQTGSKLRDYAENLEGLIANHTSRLEEAQQLGKIGHWELDLNSNQLNCSREMLRILQLDSQQPYVSLAAFQQMFHPDDSALTSKAYQDSITHHRNYDIQHRLRLADGSIKWVNQRGITHLGQDGKPLYMVGTIQDITAQKATEEQLRIASIAFETQEAIIVTDAQARIISVNRSFEKLTGYTSAEIIGKNPSILKSGRHDADYYKALWTSLQVNGTWSGEMWDKRKDGSIYPKWLTITAVRDDSGEISHYVGVSTDMTERKRTDEEIHRLAFYDTLTQLPNRKLLIDRLGQALISSQRSASHGALLFMDLDNFKALNDSKGHDIGDMLLIQVASRLTTCVRESDTVARLGGDEFVVVLQNLGRSYRLATNQAEDIAGKIIAALDTPYLLLGQEHHGSVSIGICLFQGRNVDSDELLKRADTAMYQAKSAGRNTLRVFESSMQIEIESRAALESELYHAIEKDELLPYFQSQVDTNGRITGAEVLLRWFNPERGFVPPNQFIMLAEESNLILSIGKWVMESACQQLKAWEASPATRHLQLAVNVSARQFCQTDFVAQVRAMLRKFAINPALLKLELTESMVLLDVEDTIRKMNELKRIGVQFSMDDFGTGYSSLGYLKRLPLDQIKIDQSFVRDIAIDNSDSILVKTIIDMSQNFGLEVIAEGVESHEQLQLLKMHGCVSFQGYLFSKPIPAKEFGLLVEMNARQHDNAAQKVPDCKI
ncbi:MAG: EAL domain-containing protein [Nitrosomonadales bacterium]|nr:EAL domain-containing protein [Nitrosomonadales bacterium]